MRRRTRLVITITVAFAAANVRGADLVERVVARVNDSIVTQTELDQRVNLAAKDPNAPSDSKKLRLGALEQLIRQRLIDDKAQVLGISVDSDEIDEAVGRVKTQYGLSKQEDFEKAIASTGMTLDRLREQLRQSILTNKLLAHEVPLNLTDDALRSEYERIKEKQFAVAEKAHVAEIIVTFDAADPASKEGALARIEAARNAIAAGRSFSDVAGEVTEGPARSRGGDVGWVSKGDLTEELDQAIFADKPPAGAVELKDRFVLLSILERQKAGFRPFEEIKEELRKKMSDEVYEKKFADYLRGLRDSAFVKIMDKDLATEDEAFLKSGSPVAP